jgi:ATP-dependent RNA helicase DeaD
MENLRFMEFDLSKELQKAISEMGFEEATPIQSQAIPHVLRGVDVMGQAQTGTGKTCAFGIPAIQMLDPNSVGVQVLVLCPTRELAIQMTEELKDVAKYKKGVRILPIYGGQPIDRQIMALKKKPNIIIGTPGRIMDHMRRRTLKFDNLKMVVLDEADEMLNMGFREDIDIILEGVPKERQTLLFSATMPKEIMDLRLRYQREPLLVKATHKELTVPNIEQYYIEVNESGKVEILSRLMDVNNVKLALVFCNTKKKVDELSYHMQSRGHNAEALHGDMKQVFRDKVMSKFRKGAVDILIATDVAARGIDVDDVEMVFNYDIPNDMEYYVHRIGRTGRAGRKGKAYTFVSGREIYKLRDIQRYTKSKILPKVPPTIMDVEGSKVSLVLEQVKETIRHGSFSRYVEHIENMLKDEEFNNEYNYVNSIDVAAAFLQMAVYGGNADSFEEQSMDDSEKTGANPGMVRLFMNIGRASSVSAKDIIDSIASNTNLEGNKVGKINIFEKFSFVEIPKEYSSEVIMCMKKSSIKGRRINVEKANKKNT